MNLNDYRKEIDRIDNELLTLLNKRLEIVFKVGELKKTTGTPIYIPDRENAILSRLKKSNKGRLSNKAIERIFSELFSISRNLEAPEKIAFLGPENSFTHQATQNKFGIIGNCIAINSIEGVFKEVQRGNAKYGVIPIENSSNGMVNDTVNCFDEYDLKIVGETALDIHLMFATLNQDIEKINKIYSKDIAFGQCRKFLKHFGLNHIELVPVESTVKAVKLALEDEFSAAICPSIAAESNNLPILHINIEDNNNNKTRFLILSNFQCSSSNKDKTTLLARLTNEPGSLVHFLNDFEKHNVNLTKIKSHIIEGESLFFIELNGHAEDKNIKETLEKHKEKVKILGSYQKEITDM